MKSYELPHLKQLYPNIQSEMLATKQFIADEKFLEASRSLLKISGALHFTGFSGVGNIVEEFAQLIGHMQTGTVSHKSINVDYCLNNINQYIIELVAELPDIPMKLMETYKEIRRGLKKFFHYSLLFYPNMSNTWQGILEDKGNPAQFQKHFSDFLMVWAKAPSDLSNLVKARDYLKGMLTCGPIPDHWVGFTNATIAFLEIIENKFVNKKNVEDIDKYLINNIDKEYKNNIEKAVPSELNWRILLCAISTSSIQSDYIKEVKEKHNLTNYINTIQLEINRAGKIIDDEKANTLKTLSGNFRNSWNNYTQGLTQINDLEKTLNPLNNGLLYFQNPIVSKIGDTIVELIGNIKNENIKLSGAISDAATLVILLIDQAITTRGVISESFDKNIESHIQNLFLVIKGEFVETSSLVLIDSEYQEKSLIKLTKTVLVEVKEDTNKFEESFDNWIRDNDADSYESMVEKAKPLKRLANILRMMQHDEAANVIDGIMSEMSVLFGNKKDMPKLERLSTISNKIASIGLYLDSEINGKNGSLRILGVQKEPIKPIPVKDVVVPVEQEKVIETQQSVQEITLIDEVSDNDDMLEVYLEDYSEQLLTIKGSISILSGDIGNKEAVDDIRRAFHTLKGSGRMVSGLKYLPLVAERIEHYFKRIANENLSIDAKTLDSIRLANSTFIDWKVQLENTKRITILSNNLLDSFGIDRIQGDRKEAASTNDIKVGSVTVSKELYDIFVKESIKTIESIKKELDLLVPGKSSISMPFTNYAHKLTSSSKVVGFTEISEPALLLEKLSEHFRIKKVGKRDFTKINHFVQYIEGLITTVRNKEEFVVNKKMLESIEDIITLSQTETQLVTEGKVEKLSIKDKLLQEIKATRLHLAALESILEMIEEK